jgi:hypothetical protein
MHFLFKNTIPFIVLLLISCSTLEKHKDTMFEVSYKAQTRGSFINIVFKGNTISLMSTKEDKSMVLSNNQVDSLHSIISKIKLSEIQDLKAPSNKRFTDGALIANFTIKKDNTNYISSDFDHGNPPTELKKLYDHIQSIIN